MATLGTTDKKYVSAIDSMLDTREINRLVTDIYNEDGLTDILDLANRKTPVTQSVYYTFVNESIFKLGDTAGATVTGSGSTSVTTAFTAATSGFIRKNDLVIFPNGVVGWVYSVVTTSGTDTIVIKSVAGTNITHTQGDKLSVFSRAVGEQADAPDNLSYGLTKYSNKVQIFSETSKITDVQNASTIEVEFNGQPSFIVKDHIEKMIALKGYINAAFIGGDMSTTTYSDQNPTLVDQKTVTGGGGGGAVQTTRGIDKYTTAYGISNTVGSLGTVAKADVDALLDSLIAARAPKKLLSVGGSAARRAWDTYVKALGSSGITSARLMVDGKEIDTQVDKYSYGGFEFNFSTMPILDHPNMFSQTAISKSVYHMPIDYKVKTVDGKYQPAISVKYFKQQSKFGNELIGEAHAGALSPVNPNGTAQNWTTVWTTTQGLEVLGAQFFARQKVAS